jgi:hypothetical protein
MLRASKIGREHFLFLLAQLFRSEIISREIISREIISRELGGSRLADFAVQEAWVAAVRYRIFLAELSLYLQRLLRSAE